MYKGEAVLSCGDWILGVSDGAVAELDDYYTAMVVLANVVVRLACIVCAGAAGRVGLTSGQVLPSSSHWGCLQQDRRKSRLLRGPSDVPGACQCLDVAGLPRH